MSFFLKIVLHSLHNFIKSYCTLSNSYCTLCALKHTILGPGCMNSVLTVYCSAVCNLLSLPVRLFVYLSQFSDFIYLYTSLEQSHLNVTVTRRRGTMSKSEQSRVRVNSMGSFIVDGVSCSQWNTLTRTTHTQQTL